MDVVIARVASAGWFICWVITLVQMFKRESVFLGVLGVFCGLYAFIWGWIKVKDTGQRMIMIVWSGCTLVAMVTSATALQSGTGGS